MDPRKKAKRDQEKALEMFAKIFGQEVAVESIADPVQMDKAPQYRELQGEAALLFLSKPERFITKVCAWCEQSFAATYHYVAYCCNNCRARAFKEQTGVDVDWGAKTDTERWGGEPPLIVDPETLKHLAEHVRRLNNSNPTPEKESPGDSFVVASQTALADATILRQEPSGELLKHTLEEVDFSDLL